MSVKTSQTKGPAQEDVWLGWTVAISVATFVLGYLFLASPMNSERVSGLS